MSLISERKRKLVYKRDNHQCLKCHTQKDLTIDHIVPKKLGGHNSRSNMQTLCAKCNVEKGQEIISYRKDKEKIINVSKFSKVN